MTESPAAGPPLYDSPLPESVTTVRSGGKTIHIVGTAHVSPESVREVREVIDRVRPDSVAVELDENRLAAMTDEERWKKLDIFQIIKQGKVPFLLASLALSTWQAKLGERFGVKPGAELLAAVNAAKEIGAKLVLADRDIQVTLKRVWGRLSLWDRAKLLGALLDGFFKHEEITEEQLEELRRGEALSTMMKEFAEELPQIKEPLIDERDAWLAGRAAEAPGETVVAVVGAAHVPGMVARLGQPVDFAALSTIPPPSRWMTVVKWAIPALILAAFAFGYREHSGQGLMELVMAWGVPVAVGTTVFSLLGGSRILTALSGLVLGPAAALNPTLASGMLLGLVEAWLRKPTVADCETVREDFKSLRGIYRNRFLRVLLVSVMATIGTAIGQWIGITWLLAALRKG